MFLDLEGQIEKIYTDMVEFIYYMRGSIKLDEALEMTTIEKNIAIKWLNKYLEKELKKPHPNY